MTDIYQEIYSECYEFGRRNFGESPKWIRVDNDVFYKILKHKEANHALGFDASTGRPKTLFGIPFFKSHDLSGIAVG